MATTLTGVSREDVLQILNKHFTPDARGMLLKQVQVWKILAGLAVLMALAGHAGLFVLAMRPGLIPYPIVYDPDGRIIRHGPAETTREALFIDVALLEVVEWMRDVPKDEALLHKNREKAMAHMHGNALVKFKAYNKDAISAYLDKPKRVLVKVDWNNMRHTRRAEKQIWVSWSETWTPDVGYGSETHQFEATLDYDWYAKPKGFTLAQARLNPRRLYVTDYTWDEVRQGVR